MRADNSVVVLPVIGRALGQCLLSLAGVAKGLKGTAGVPQLHQLHLRLFLYIRQQVIIVVYKHHLRRGIQAQKLAQHRQAVKQVALVAQDGDLHARYLGHLQKDGFNIAGQSIGAVGKERHLLRLHLAVSIGQSQQREASPRQLLQLLFFAAADKVAQRPAGRTGHLVRLARFHRLIAVDAVGIKKSDAHGLPHRRLVKHIGQLHGFLGAQRGAVAVGKCHGNDPGAFAAGKDDAEFGVLRGHRTGEGHLQLQLMADLLAAFNCNSGFGHIFLRLCGSCKKSLLFIVA